MRLAECREVWRVFRDRLAKAFPPTDPRFSEDEETQELVQKRKEVNNPSAAPYPLRDAIDLSLGFLWAKYSEPAAHEYFLAAKFLSSADDYSQDIRQAMKARGLQRRRERMMKPPLAEKKAFYKDSKDDIGSSHQQSKDCTVARLASPPPASVASTSASNSEPSSAPAMPESTEVVICETATATLNTTDASQAVGAAIEALAYVKNHVLDESLTLKSENSQLKVENKQLQKELAEIKDKHDVDRRMLDSLHNMMRTWTSQVEGDN